MYTSSMEISTKMHLLELCTISRLPYFSMSNHVTVLWFPQLSNLFTFKQKLLYQCYILSKSFSFSYLKS